MPEESIEVSVARLDERMRGLQGLLAGMAADQRKMAESYEKLVESNQRISLLEMDMVNIKKSTDMLWKKLDGMTLTKEKTFREWSLMVGTQLVGMMCVIALYHFGFKA